MEVIVVSSPGNGRATHWSHAAADRLACSLAERGVSVHRLAAVHRAQLVPSSGAAATAAVHSIGRPKPLPRAALAQRHVALEIELTRLLRMHPAAPVVHVGIGARGSPNLLWLADRLGSRTFGAVRSAEVVCCRGDLVDRDGRPCRDYSDAERCRWCCSGWLRKPRIVDLLNRIDMLVGGLLVADALQVPDPAAAEVLTGLGIPPHKVVVAPDPVALGDRIAAAVVAHWR